MNFARNQNSEQRLSALFGLAIFSHQSFATGTLLLQKDIYPRKYCQIFTNYYLTITKSGFFKFRKKSKRAAIIIKM